LAIDSVGEAVAAAAVTLGCFGLSVAQRRLSTPVRELRRRTVSISGVQLLGDGTTQKLTPAQIAAPLDAALKAIAASLVLLSVALVAVRV
jgi:hypothetical protein